MCMSFRNLKYYVHDQIMNEPLTKEKLTRGNLPTKKKKTQGNLGVWHLQNQIMNEPLTKRFTMQSETKTLIFHSQSTLKAI